ncbi:hypothetical protein ABPG74_022570 [Tetrahymena malaccensis]
MIQQNKQFNKLEDFLNSSLQTHTHLHIDILGNYIGDEGTSGLGSALANCTNLSNLVLYLRSNQIGANGALGLGSALANCTNLSNLVLYLGHNQIGADGASGLGSALANCTNLSNLTLSLDRYYQIVNLPEGIELKSFEITIKKKKFQPQIKFLQTKITKTNDMYKIISLLFEYDVFLFIQNDNPISTIKQQALNNINNLYFFEIETTLLKNVLFTRDLIGEQTVNPLFIFYDLYENLS